APGPAVVAQSIDVKPAVSPRRTAPASKPKRVSRSIRRVALVGSPRTIAHALLLRRGWSEGEWSCLDALWNRESGWDVTASNGGSGAYGIPQALPASKMATMGSDWRTNPVTQIRWGLSYIARTYGDPCSALDHSNNYGYY
ncbi:MAG: transglycosylase SLT domain-containing protein, partial [Frankiaceae bacterium]|nr:transglycosylase SLT domain-containing protein [Frankiaceae bacterium]MBV9368690.1 transglycosylase SLT domain-containing protein [Frankiales bacterium]